MVYGGIIGSARRVAMQYSPNCAVPYVAMVDAGTVELVRGMGVDVVTSANLIQHFESRWNQRRSNHLEAGRRIDQIRADAFAHDWRATRTAARSRNGRCSSSSWTVSRRRG